MLCESTRSADGISPRWNAETGGPWVRRALPSRLLSGNEVVARNVGERRDLRLEQVDVDVHALARLCARQQAREDGRLGVKARRKIWSRTSLSAASGGERAESSETHR
mgnify:CR=1 FL=1